MDRFMPIIFAPVEFKHPGVRSGHTFGNSCPRRLEQVDRVPETNWMESPFDRGNSCRKLCEDCPDYSPIECTGCGLVSVQQGEANCWPWEYCKRLDPARGRVDVDQVVLTEDVLPYSKKEMAMLPNVKKRLWLVEWNSVKFCDGTHSNRLARRLDIVGTSRIGATLSMVRLTEYDFDAAFSSRIEAARKSVDTGRWQMDRWYLK